MCYRAVLKWDVMGTAVLQAIGSFAAGAIAWVALEFFGRPLRKFYDLRGETVYRLAKVANVRSRPKASDKQSASGEVEEFRLSEAELVELADARKEDHETGCDRHHEAARDANKRRTIVRMSGSRLVRTEN
jgi:hypothetical protein